MRCPPFSRHRLEVLPGLVDGRLLLGAHGEVARAPLGVVRAVPDGQVGGPHVIDRAAEPLGLLAVTVAEPLEAVLLEVVVDLVVHECGAVGAHGRGSEHDLVGLLTGLERRVVLVHALLDRARGVSDLEHALELWVVRLAIGVNDGLRIGTSWEEFAPTHRCHRSEPLASSSTLFPRYHHHRGQTGHIVLCPYGLGLYLRRERTQNIPWICFAWESPAR